MTVVLTFAAGLLLWTFLEYVIHNWLGHLPKGRTLSSREHLRHHSKSDYFSPLTKKLLAVVPVLSVAVLAVWPVFGLAVGVGLSAGVGAGWLAYEVVHRLIHVRAPKTAYGRWARRHHLHHHFMRPNVNHGVTTPIWDWVFRTYERPGRIKVPKKQAPRLPWLHAKDDPTRIAPQFAGDFCLG